MKRSVRPVFIVTNEKHHSAKLSHLVDALISPVLLFRALTVSFLNPFRRAQKENAAGQIVIGVKWGRDRFNVPIPNPSITPLSQLIATLSTQTGIPPDALKLIYKGAILKDASLTLSAYGIEDGSTLALVGSNQPAPSAPAAAPKAQVVKKKNKQPETASQEVLVDWIRGLVDGALSPLQASIEAFVRNSRDDKQVEGNRPAQKPTFEVLQREHARLSETLLRSLLDLDGVEIPSEWQDARKERKEGVKRVQGELTRVDDAWGTRKRIGQ